MIKKRIKYFLLLVTALLFQIIREEKTEFETKEALNSFQKEEKSEKTFYSCVIEFQQRVEGFGAKKIKKNSKEKNNVVFSFGDNIAFDFFEKNFLKIIEKGNFVYKCLQNVFGNNFIGEKMHKSSYLV